MTVQNRSFDRLAGKRSAGERTYWAFWGHRLSGLALALFLPMHFYVLGLAIEGRGQLDSFLTLAENPLFKFAEWGLVILLTIHLGFGLRLLAIDWLPAKMADPSRQKWLIPSLAIASIIGIALAFAMLG